MNIIRIAVKEFIQNIRDTTVMMIMIIFPILLIFLLGAALSNRMDNSIYQTGQARIEYQSFGEERALTVEVSALMQKFINKEGQWIQSQDREESIERLKDNQIAAYLEINEDDRKIIFYSNSNFFQQATILRSLIKSRFNNSRKLPVDSKASDYKRGAVVEIEKLEGDNPGALDYYGVSIVVLFIVYGISNSIIYTMKERKQGSQWRILMTPTSRISLIAGKILGNFMVNSAQLAVVFLTTILIFNVNWGSQITEVILLLLSAILMTISSGMLIGFSINNEGITLTFIHIMIVIFAFFGGSYMSLKGMGWLAEVGKYFSPIWWITNGIMKTIYETNTVMLKQAISINITLTVIFVTASWLILKRSVVQ